MQAPPRVVESYARKVFGLDVLLMLCALCAAEIGLLHLFMHTLGWVDVSMVSATLATLLLARLA